MATGYTHPVAEGKVTELKPFAMSCARAMCPLWFMRDYDMNVEIPDKAPLSTYHRDALERSQKQLAAFVLLSDEEALAELERQHTELIAYNAECRDRAVTERARFNAMLQKVKEWEPPELLDGLKKFMISQLEESIEYSLRPENYPTPTKPTLAEWTAQEISRLSGGIEYHAKELADEQARAAEATAWIQMLKSSLL